MYFKRLELFGFKSFADKTRLDFDQGITAIVGPNGCGKSNIVDAIKWVLGEQSAKMMRGAKMEDVIFNGTDGKEPLSYAEVSLTLSNQDRIFPIEYDEVTVTRRLYRSGESEYLLNRTPVRLKDISELFMGTGIGTDAYSLIEQGRIDQVLSSKPEERREVFEEASGITKYKSKRKEALRRLEDTEDNLVRINDIIQEVKRQIASIERQVKKAERYKEKYEELKELELRLSRIELQRLKERISLSNQNLDEHRNTESQLSSEMQRWAEELDRFRIQRSHIEGKMMDFKSSIIEMDSEISKSRDKFALNKERIDELKKKQEELDREIEKNQLNIISQQKEVASLRSKVASLETENMEISNTLSAREKSLQEVSKGISENETNISIRKANIIDIAAKEAKLRNQLAKISTTLSTHDARIKRLRTEKKTVLDEKDGLDDRLRETMKEKGYVESEISSLRIERDKFSRAICDKNLRIEKAIDEAKETLKILATNKSRLEVLEEAKAKYEGFSSGVRAIFGKDRANGQCGIEGLQDVLANFLRVKKGYESAIESALGEDIESIVVDSMESAEKAVSFLKENSSGRASFIHPGAFEDIPDEREVSLLKDRRILGQAVDFVTVAPIYRNIIKYLLRGVFIVKDIEDAGSVLKEDRDLNEYTFVTLLGEIVKRGFISGGTVAKEGINLINRDAKIKELSDAITRLEEDSHRIERDRVSWEKEKEELEKMLEDTGKRLNEKEILSANLKSRCANIEENIKALDDEISLLNLEIEEVTNDVTSLKKEEGSHLKALANLEEEGRLNGESIRMSENLISEYTSQKEKLLIEIAEQRTQLGSLETKKEGLSNTLSILESSLNDVEFSSRSRMREIEGSIKKIEELNQTITRLETNINSLSEERAKRACELEDIGNSYSEIVQNIRHREAIFKESEKKVNELQSILHRVDIEKTEVHYSIDNLTQRIRDIYKTNLDEVTIPEGWENIEASRIKKEVEEKRTKLEAMGPVNLVAIEEHTELQDRFLFLTNQRDDLLKAKETLLKAIAKINKTTKELFIEAFNNIQAEFSNFFKMLFGGGNGELILLDEDNVLESGIEIIARPPGKKFQNVSLLSGGEKALTAIALIFAIFKVRPSPFCVLDEIDAPLDESNVDRFSRSLDIFTKTSQFIVITHNKKTIDMANMMYGITMQESGISKVVSVKFSEGKEFIEKN